MKLWLSHPVAGSILFRLIGVVLSLLALLFAWWLFDGFQSSSKAAELRGDASQLEKNNEGKRNLIAKAGELAIESAPAGLKAVTSFQRNVEAQAVHTGCELTEFTSSSQQRPYLSRYANVTENNDWSQIEVKLKIRGEMPEVLAALRGFSGFEQPYEFNAIDLKRIASDGTGAALVEASVDLRVLSK